METIKAWHFASTDKKLRYGDGRQMRIGRTHKVKGKPELCENGLHASERLIDALQYAPGCYLFEVELSGEFDIGSDKVCATERKYIRGFNAEKLLREFARKQALINLEKIKDYTNDDDYDLIERFLLTGDESIRPAAWSAARSVARSAARSLAWSLAWSVARSVARSAARSAAESAAEAASGPASGSVAWSAADKMLTDMVMEEFKRMGK